LLLSSAHSFKDASAACEALGEKLFNPLSSLVDEVQQSLNFLIFSGKFEAGQQFWIASEGSNQRAINTHGGFSLGNGVSRLSLPVLCTQTAPFSDIGFQNTSSQWQISLESNNQILTG
jgi:hypothetical protein